MPASSNRGVNFPGPPSSLLEEAAGDGNGVARGTAGTAKLLREAAGTALLVSDGLATVLSPGGVAASRVSFCPCWAHTGRASIALNPTVRHNLRIVVLQRLFHRNRVCYSRAHRVSPLLPVDCVRHLQPILCFFLEPIGKTSPGPWTVTRGFTSQEAAKRGDHRVFYSSSLSQDIPTHRRLPTFTPCDRPFVTFVWPLRGTTPAYRFHKRIDSADLHPAC